METAILAQVDASIICLMLLVLMLLAVALGNKTRKRYWGGEEEAPKGGVNALLGALFGLWGFTLAFSFGQAGSRFESVKATIVDEANLFRTCILKADLFPDSVREAYRSDFKKYLEERINYYDYAADATKFNTNREEISKSAATLWARTVEQSKNPNLSTPAASMVLSLTGLFDLGIKREALLSAGIPFPITFMLIALALAICFVGGYTTPGIKRKEWIVISVFALLASSFLYITIDLSRPMQGLIKPDAGQTTIINLRKLL